MVLTSGRRLEVQVPRQAMDFRPDFIDYARLGALAEEIPAQQSISSGLRRLDQCAHPGFTSIRAGHRAPSFDHVDPPDSISQLVRPGLLLAGFMLDSLVWTCLDWSGLDRGRRESRDVMCWFFCVGQWITTSTHTSGSLVDT